MMLAFAQLFATASYISLHSFFLFWQQSGREQKLYEVGGHLFSSLGGDLVICALVQVAWGFGTLHPRFLGLKNSFFSIAGGVFFLNLVMIVQAMIVQKELDYRLREVPIYNFVMLNSCKIACFALVV